MSLIASFATVKDKWIHKWSIVIIPVPDMLPFVGSSVGFSVCIVFSSLLCLTSSLRVLVFCEPL